jgi:hypothetical protein
MQSKSRPVIWGGFFIDFGMDGSATYQIMRKNLERVHGLANDGSAKAKFAKKKRS